MPSFEFLPNIGRFRDASTKRFVSRGVILKHVDRQSNRLATKLNRNADLLTNGAISLARFHELMIEDMKLAHLQMASLGAGGRANMDEVQLGAVGNRLRQEYRLLRNFVVQIGRGELSEAQIKARASLYGQSSAAAFYKAEQIIRVKGGAREARRTLDPSPSVDHCPQCPALSQGVWLPVDQVVPPTRRCQCRSRCRCRIEYRNVSLSDSLPDVG